MWRGSSERVINTDLYCDRFPRKSVRPWFLSCFQIKGYLSQWVVKERSKCGWNICYSLSWMDFILSSGLENPGGKKQSKYSDNECGLWLLFCGLFWGGKNLPRMCQYFTPKIYIILFFVFLKRVKTIYKFVHHFCNCHPTIVDQIAKIKI